MRLKLVKKITST